MVSESFASVIESADDSCKNVLTQLYHLHLLSVIENNLGPLILSGKSSSLCEQLISKSWCDGDLIVWVFIYHLRGLPFLKGQTQYGFEAFGNVLAKIPEDGHMD